MQETQETQTVSTAAVTAEDVLVDFREPVQGDIVCGFSIDSLVYNDTLAQWATHSGVDYAAKEGTPVTAVLEGTVESIQNDPLLGLTVTLRHECGVKSVYAGLGATQESLQQDAHVSAGDVIASVGTSAASEAHLGAHLHFELLTPEGYVDPSAQGNT